MCEEAEITLKSIAHEFLFPNFCCFLHKMKLQRHYPRFELLRFCKTQHFIMQYLISMIALITWWTIKMKYRNFIMYISSYIVHFPFSKIIKIVITLHTLFYLIIIKYLVCNLIWIFIFRFHWFETFYQFKKYLKITYEVVTVGKKPQFIKDEVTLNMVLKLLCSTYVWTTQIWSLK